MRMIKCSNGVTIRAYVGDGFDGASGVYVQKGNDAWAKSESFGFDIPHKDLPKVIRLLEWYIKAETRLREEEGKLWLNVFETGDGPRLESEANPYQIIFRIGHLKSHLRTRRGKDGKLKLRHGGCGYKPRT